MHEQKIKRTYYRELLGSSFLYIAVVWLSTHFGKDMQPGLIRTSILLSPMLPALLMIWAIARHVQRVDEYVRLRLLENMALAAGITAALSLTYSFMETAGFPRLSMLTVWIVMFGVFGVTDGLHCLRTRLQK